jgi:hypothetical protein
VWIVFLYLVKNCLIKTYIGRQVEIQALFISVINQGGGADFFGLRPFFSEKRAPGTHKKKYWMDPTLSFEPRLLDNSFNTVAIFKILSFWCEGNNSKKVQKQNKITPGIHVDFNSHV